MNAPVKIEKGIPIPPARRGSGQGREPVYPFRTMEVGDSFSVPLSGKVNRQNGSDLARTRISTSAAYVQRKTSRKFTTRLLKEEGIIRCWRVA